MSVKIKPVVKRLYGTIEFNGAKFECYPDGKCIRLDTGRDVSKNRPDSAGYIHVCVSGKNVLLHRLLSSCLRRNIINNPEIQIDHIDRDTSNNAITNLREATNAENNANRGLSSNNTSGESCIGAYYKNKRRSRWRWRVSVWKLGKPHYKFHPGGDGPIPDDVYDHIPDEVIAIRDHLKLSLHGEFAGFY